MRVYLIPALMFVFAKGVCQESAFDPIQAISE
jgi:hypothetical protein